MTIALMVPQSSGRLLGKFHEGTICMKRDRWKSPTRRPRPPLSLEDSEIWLAFADELDLIDHLLRCVPELTLAAQLAQNEDLRADPSDPIGDWLKEYRGRVSGRSSPIPRDGEDDASHSRTDILSAPDAMVDVARGRLERLRLFLETMRQPRQHPPCRKRRS